MSGVRLYLIVLAFGVVVDIGIVTITEVFEDRPGVVVPILDSTGDDLNALPGEWPLNCCNQSGGNPLTSIP